MKEEKRVICKRELRRKRGKKDKYRKQDDENRVGCGKITEVGAKWQTTDYDIRTSVQYSDSQHHISEDNLTRYKPSHLRHE